MSALSGIRDDPDRNRAVWFTPTLLSIALIVVALTIYWDTTISIVSTWWGSKTYEHGFLIFPISAFLIWQRRESLVRIAPKSDFRGLIVLAVLGLGWLLADLTDINLVQQLCLVSMIPVLVWSLLGGEVAKNLAFPLGFLLFAVPVGEFLVPPLMSFTADFTVNLVQITGIPIYREGNFLSLPSGDWSVVEACSGIRYLIASITLGALYAYLTYQSFPRRLAFMGLAVFFPIFANGLRAYMIVMIGHLSDMKLATGVDHIIYGWIFFGFVMLLMFWIGSLWREPHGRSESRKNAIPLIKKHPKPGAFLALSVLALTILVIWPARATYLSRIAAARSDVVTIESPHVRKPWQPNEAEITDWQPHYVDPDVIFKAAYNDGRNDVGLYFLYYRSQTDGAELITWQNVLATSKDSVWRIMGEKPIEISLTARKEPLKVLEGRIRSADQKLLVWRWNWVGGIHTTNNYFAKYLEAKNKLFGTFQDASGIVVYTEFGDESDVNRANIVLQHFVDKMYRQIDQNLRKSSSH